MFEHRLGLALGKSLGEIRALPYPEFHAWELFYLLEPWGWADREYHTASLLTILYNVNRGKGKAKTVKDFMRDMQKLVLDELDEGPDLSEMTFEQQREFIINQLKRDFGVT